MSYEMVGDSREVMSSLSRGNNKRVVAAMSMNPRSSRGHAIFTIYVKEMTATGGERHGKLNLVDLAGMESSKKVRGGGGGGLEGLVGLEGEEGLGGVERRR